MPNVKNEENNKGHVIWLTGISGAGKTTLANSLQKHLEKYCLQVELLDGDKVREFFENDLGYKRADRIQNIRRITFAAKLLADHGVVAIVANIAPYYEVRDFIRKKLPRYCQIYVKASIEVVALRDVKGLYKDFNCRQMTDLIGLDDLYEIPRLPNLVVDTDKETIECSFQKILDYLLKKGFIR
jgi:adenylylsulfate kinase